MREPCPVSLAEIENDQPYERVINRNYSDDREEADPVAIRAAIEFRNQMVEFGYAFRGKNMYTIADCIEQIKEESLWKTKPFNGKTVNELYHEDKDKLTDLYIIGALGNFKIDIENEVNSLAKQVFKL